MGSLFSLSAEQRRSAESIRDSRSYASMSSAQASGRAPSSKDLRRAAMAGQVEAPEPATQVSARAATSKDFARDGGNVNVPPLQIFARPNTIKDLARDAHSQEDVAQHAAHARARDTSRRDAARDELVQRNQRSVTVSQSRRRNRRNHASSPRRTTEDDYEYSDVDTQVPSLQATPSIADDLVVETLAPAA